MTDMAVDRTSKKRARPEAISSNNSEEQTLTTTNVPIRTARDHQAGDLSNLSLVDFLQDDPRLTCIIDTTLGFIAYCNPALERLLASTWNLPDFRDWAATTFNSATQSASYRGRAWNCILQQGRWLVATAQQDEPIVQVHADALAPPRAPPPPRTASQNSNSAIASADSRRQSVASSSWRTVSDDGGQRYLDWTRSPSPAMSAHMHLVRNFPWQDTSVGSIQSWSDALRGAVLSAMANPDPRLLLWGDDHIMIYNEACTSMFAERHPRALGSRAEETWADIWPDMYPVIKYVQTEGRGTRLNKLPLIMHRNGYPEDTYWSFNLIPVVGPQGSTIGIIDEFSEVTEHVVGDRRRDAIVRINKAIVSVNSVKELWFEFLEGLERSFCTRHGFFFFRSGFAALRSRGFHWSCCWPPCRTPYLRSQRLRQRPESSRSCLLQGLEDRRRSHLASQRRQSATTPQPRRPWPSLRCQGTNSLCNSFTRHVRSSNNGLLDSSNDPSSTL
jgi:hypothetical protein